MHLCASLSIEDKFVMQHRVMSYNCFPFGNSVFMVAVLSLLFVIQGCTRSSDLEWEEEDGYRWADVDPGFFGSTGFDQLGASQTGIHFRNDISEEEIGRNRHYLNGSGVAAGDVNGDGLVDLYFSGLGTPNKLYENMGGMRFRDVTEEAGLGGGDHYSTGVVFADVNGNGHLDLLVSYVHGDNSLYINDGGGNFELEENSGLESADGSTTMALADVNNDGYLDLYIAKYKERSVKDMYTTQELAWENIINEPLVNATDTYTLTPPFDQHYKILTQNGEFSGIYEIGEKDDFYINTGGKFEKVRDTENVFLDEEGAPFGLQPDWGLTAKFQDLNDDGLPDLYVCNDFETPDRVWMNQGNGTFKAIPWYAIRSFSFSCMAVDFSDVDKNGSTDIFTTEMLSPDHQRRMSQFGAGDPVTIQIGDIESRPMYNRNSMYIQREDDTFAEVSRLSGVEATGWSWATRFMDVNLDGYEDIIVATGHAYDILDVDAQIEMAHEGRNMDEHYLEFLNKTQPLNLPNRIIRNNGDLTFDDMKSEWGMSESDVSHGMAFADLNNDGAQDVVFNRLNNEAAIYENTTNAPRIAVRLEGQAPNTQAIGAKIELSGGPVSQKKEITAGGDYASGSEPMVVFAADPANDNHGIMVNWPGGHQSRIDGVKANRIYIINEAGGEPTNTRDGGEVGRIERGGMFEDVSSYLDHRHHENDFEDARFSPLAPVKLSRLGPGMAWIDYDKTGFDDLFVASGRGGRVSILENQGSGSDGFTSVPLGEMSQESIGDQSTVLGWSEDDYIRISIGVSSYEAPGFNESSVYTYKIGEDGNIDESEIGGIPSAVGPMAAADVNNDGYLDLFVGGRFDPGRYPQDADSRLFVNDKGEYRIDENNRSVFSDIGNVTGATFADISGNGCQDLVISSEWGPIRIFENQNGIFREITDELGLNEYLGWWNSVAVGDFTNDGLLDIVADNMGLNSVWGPRGSRPLKMYYSDLNRNGIFDIIDSYANNEGEYVPRKKMYEFQEAGIFLNRMGSHQEFASSTLEEIFGNRLQHLPYKEINTMEHMIFVNTGEGKFEAHPLPLEAQFTAAFSANVADFDNDGNEDLFLSQNLFALSDGTPRMDAGRGLILRGDGAGGFTPVPGSESGIKVYGEQRGAALNDFDRDGKVDLAVAQNGAQTRLFRNRAEKAGYSVMLVGLPGNQDGVGSSIRLVYASGEKGPRRNVQSGSGYWSQNGFTQVMGAAASVQVIQVTWPDGERQDIPVTEDEKRYTIVHPDVD